MHILVISHMFPASEDDNSGVFVLEQIKQLSELGCKITVFSPKPWVPLGFSKLKKRWKEYSTIPKFKEIIGIPIYYPRYFRPPGFVFFPFISLSMTMSVFKTFITLRKNINVDVIHSHTVLPDGFSALLLGKYFHIPVVCTAHGSDINTYPFNNKIVFLLTKFVLKKVNFFIAVSKSLNQKAQSIEKSQKNFVINNGYDPQKFFPIDKHEARLKLHLPDLKIILFIGSFNYDKGAHFLIPILNELLRIQSEIFLYVIGDGELEHTIKQQAISFDVEKYIRIIKKQPHDLIPLWINASDLVILPSISEGFPTLIPEIMACGKPIVASKVGGIPEIITDEVGILTEPGDVMSFALSILELLNKNNNTSRVVELSKNFTWRVIAMNYLKIYESIIRENHI